ncbi:extensin family protein [Sphingomonas quercus]|uniref:extensin family protein n=1 Tax=Sphingomonas quercus TaxID=2842451 RepID=UPI00209AFB91|nr:extensin family protein [Sphingomonas quercus]
MDIGVGVRSSGLIIAVLLALLVAACVGPGGRAPAPPRRPAQPARPVPPVADDQAMRQCFVDLAHKDARYTRLPDRDFGNGCSAIGTVKLLDMGMPTTNLGAMTCPLASKLIEWTQEALQKAAQAWLDSPIARVDSFGTYNCRPIAGTTHLSQHGRSNAVDISGFVLANGRRITVLNDWNGPDENARNFLRAVRAAARRRFNIVLGPDANADHRNHLHFDMGPGHACR